MQCLLFYASVVHNRHTQYIIITNRHVVLVCTFIPVYIVYNLNACLLVGCFQSGWCKMKCIAAHNTY